MSKKKTEDTAQEAAATEAAAPEAAATEAAAPEAAAGKPAAAPEMVTVKVIKQPLAENGIHYKAGETFQTTRQRAEGLCALVEIVNAPAEEAAPEA